MSFIFFSQLFANLNIKTLGKGISTKIFQGIDSNFCSVVYSYNFAKIGQNFHFPVGRTTEFWSARYVFESSFLPISFIIVILENAFTTPSNVIIFHPFLWYGRKITHSKTQSGAFFIFCYQLSGQSPDFLMQSLAKYKTAQNTTEIVMFLKTFKVWGYFKKIDGFFQKETLTFFKIGECGKFAVECLTNDISSWKGIFHLICEVFWRKSENFKIWKSYIFEEELYLKKKRFLYFKRHLYQN